MTIGLSRGEKLAYGVADVGASLSFVAINTWFLYFLINIAGLEPFLAGVIFIIGRAFDAVLDPIMGSFSDRTKSRWGRKRFIWLGAVPLGASFVLLWLLPQVGPAGRFALALGLFMLFSLLYTIVQVPYMALTPELAPDYDERTSLTSYRVGFATFASLVAVAAPPAIVMRFGGAVELAQSQAWGWLVMGLIFGAITAASYLLMASFVREPASTRQRSTGRVKLLAEYRSAFAIYGFAEIFVLFIVITIGLMVLNSILPFFLESSLLLSPGQQPLVLGTLFGAAILAFPLWAALATRLGKRISLILGLIILAFSVLLLVGFSPPGTISVYLLIMTVLSGIGLSAIMLFPWAMLPDVVEFDELKTGTRHEGLVYALFTFGQKIAGSVGVFSNALVASLFGYQQGLAMQAPTTVNSIEVMAGPVAAAIFLLAIFFVWRFPITRSRHSRARAELAERPA